MEVSQESIETRIICPQCNAPIKAGAKFCPVCGRPVSGQAVQPAAVPQSAATSPKTKGFLAGKGKLIIIAAVVVIVIIIVLQLNSPVNLVKSGALADFSSQTIGEMIDDNFKKVTWSSEKLDSASGFVYAEGYCVTFQQNMCFEFYYDKDSGELSLLGIDWLDSGETDTNWFSMALTLGMLYD